MPLEKFIIWVYCWTDENVAKVIVNEKLRSKGFEPALSDIEVITMKVVGEFLSHDTDKAIWKYFKIHWLSLFPKLTMALKAIYWLIIRAILRVLH
jgi:hypothetical protein